MSEKQEVVEASDIFNFEFTPSSLDAESNGIINGFSDISDDKSSDGRHSNTSSSINLKTRLSSLSGKFTLGHLRWLLIITTILSLLLFSIFVTSIAAYLVIYRMYMPIMQHKVPLYFQYHPDSQPTALIEKYETSIPLRAGVAYDFFLDLEIPDVPGLSENLGNFMTSLELSTGQESWFKAARPALLPYRSALTRFTSTWIKMAPLLLGWTEERIYQRVFLADSVKIPSIAVYGPSSINVRLSNPQIPLYRADLLITAHLNGVRYFMYHWRISSAILIISGLFFGQVGLLTVLFLVIYLVRKLRKQPERERFIRRSRSASPTEARLSRKAHWRSRSRSRSRSCSTKLWRKRRSISADSKTSSVQHKKFD